MQEKQQVFLYTKPRILGSVRHAKYSIVSIVIKCKAPCHAQIWRTQVTLTCAFEKLSESESHMYIL